MKKITILAIAAVATAFAHGASIDWQVSFAGAAAGRIMDTNGKVWTNATSGNSGQTAYLMLSSQVDAFVAALNAGTSLDGLYLDSSTSFNANTGAMSSLGTATSDSVTTASQNFQTILVYNTVSGEDTLTFYQASAVVASGERAQASDPAQVFFPSNTSFGGTWTQTGDVPEPTSGLLLLLGAAGLALRRRRA